MKSFFCLVVAVFLSFVIMTNSQQHLVEAVRFSRDEGIVLPLQQNKSKNDVMCGCIDVRGRYAYLGIRSTPGLVFQFNLQNFTIGNGNKPLQLEYNSPIHAIVDSNVKFAYFVTEQASSYRGVLEKIRLSDFTHAGSLLLNTYQRYAYGLATNKNDTVAYVGSYYTSSWGSFVGKIYLTNFSTGPLLQMTTVFWISPLVMNSDETFLYGGATNADITSFDSVTQQGIVVKIDITHYQPVHVSTITLASKSTLPMSVFLTDDGSYLCGSTYSAPGYFFAVTTADDKLNKTIDLMSGLTVADDGGGSHAAVKAAGDVAFVGVIGKGADGGKIVKIDLQNMSETGRTNLSAAEEDPHVLLNDATDCALFVYAGTRNIRNGIYGSEPGHFVRVATGNEVIQGHFQDGGLCRKCPAGTSSNVTGLQANTSEVCRPVGPGAWSPPGSANASRCQAGTFCNSSSGCADECARCPADYYTNTTGSTQCKLCQNGLTTFGETGSAGCSTTTSTTSSTSSTTSTTTSLTSTTTSSTTTTEPTTSSTSTTSSTTTTTEPTSTTAATTTPTTTTTVTATPAASSSSTIATTTPTPTSTTSSTTTTSSSTTSSTMTSSTAAPTTTETPITTTSAITASTASPTSTSTEAPTSSSASSTSSTTPATTPTPTTATSTTTSTSTSTSSAPTTTLTSTATTTTTTTTTTQAPASMKCGTYLDAAACRADNMCSFDKNSNTCRARCQHLPGGKPACDKRSDDCFWDSSSSSSFGACAMSMCVSNETLRNSSSNCLNAAGSACCWNHVNETCVRNTSTNWVQLCQASFLGAAQDAGGALTNGEEGFCDDAGRCAGLIIGILALLAIIAFVLYRRSRGKRGGTLQSVATHQSFVPVIEGGTPSSGGFERDYGDNDGSGGIENDSIFSKLNIRSAGNKATKRIDKADEYIDFSSGSPSGSGGGDSTELTAVASTTIIPKTAATTSASGTAGDGDFEEGEELELGDTLRGEFQDMDLGATQTLDKLPIQGDSEASLGSTFSSL